MFFQDDADFSHKLRMLPALAFVPEDAVVEAFEKLADYLPDETDAVKLPRTNNSVEGWHCRFQSSITCKHPNFWKFMEALKGEQTLQQVHVAHVVYIHMLARHPAEPPRMKYADNNQRIRQLVQNGIQSAAH